MINFKPEALLIAITVAMSSMPMANADSYDSSTGILTMDFVKVGSTNYQIQLRLNDNDQFVLVSAVPATKA